MSSTKIMSNVIALTTDPDRLAKLRNKLAEYERRIGVQAPEIDPQATYKYSLLKGLLDAGVLDADEKEAAFAKDEWYQPAAFRDALGVIEAYNAGELAALRGGTGLR